MRKVSATGPVVRGLDVSHYDGVIDFKMVKLSGRDFAFAKCTEYNADKTYARNKAQAKEAGMLFGAYHFFHPSKDPFRQAKDFLSYAQLEKGNLPAVLDWESTDNVSRSEDRLRALTWLRLVGASTGKPPIIYGSPYFLNDLRLDAAVFDTHPLWIAHYGTSAPLVPFPWNTWTFWQHTDKGAVPGIPAPDEDLDVFNGTYEDLEKILL